MSARPDQRSIYETDAETYDRLVSAEDVDRNLPRALRALGPLAGAPVLEVGAGTGRITRWLVREGARVVAFDRAPAMLAVARRRLADDAAATDARAEPARGEVRLGVADAAHLPVPDGWADLAVAGWVFGHFQAWMPAGWQAAVGTALAEMRRALRPGGWLAVIETLGTGREEPAPPSEGLARYYAWLEGEQGFARTAIRTDYAFADLTGRGARLPECTGVWTVRR